MLSSADVEQKTFSTALRGYDLDEVDDFLDEIVATIKELNQQLEAARAARDEEATTPPAPAPVPEPESDEEPEAAAETRLAVDESAIGRALVAAQNAADQLLEEAQSQADQIIEEAKNQADSFVAERDAKKREVEAEIGVLSARVSSVRSELSVLAGEVAEKLDDMDQILTGAGETDTGPAMDEEDEADTPDAVSVVEDMPDPLDSEDTPDDFDSDDSPDNLDFGDTPEEGQRDEEGGGGSDHLDEILTGVTNDLRLDSDVPEDADEDDGDSDDADDSDDFNDER